MASRFGTTLQRSAPVLFSPVARCTTVPEVERLLVAFDGTPLAERALEYALTTYPETEVTVIHVIDYLDEGYGAEALVGAEELRERAHAARPSRMSDFYPETGERVGRSDIHLLRVG